MQLKGERVMDSLDRARAARLYDVCMTIVQKAHYNFKLMAALLQVGQLSRSIDLVALWPDPLTPLWALGSCADWPRPSRSPVVRR
jgi:hypothetical protein